MINVHPSDQMQAFTHYMYAWIAIVALLVGLAAFSGRTAVGLAVGILIATALVLVAKGAIQVPHG